MTLALLDDPIADGLPKITVSSSQAKWVSSVFIERTDALAKFDVQVHVKLEPTTAHKYPAQLKKRRERRSPLGALVSVAFHAVVIAFYNSPY